MSILSTADLSNLLKVKTTRPQARQILKRNKGLLKYLNSLPTTDKEYGE